MLPGVITVPWTIATPGTVACHRFSQSTKLLPSRKAGAEVVGFRPPALGVPNHTKPEGKLISWQKDPAA